MAILVINSDDYTEKLKDFSLTCQACGSKEVELEIDWAAYPSDSWLIVKTICKTCHTEETITSTH
jgi:hypothetical protein